MAIEKPNMNLVIKSEAEYKKVMGQLYELCSHPLYFECRHYDQDIKEMQDALDKWDEDNSL
ncbi:hypothetical protein BS333_20985 (plasmid) [Vibrio azureus]|uniref:Uncharacterized protein n=1 Tax=Vibrio azureus NBRC 104587 TaxID=1219077 RepID=U3APP8_9VIBR|nr:hypothetical protein [Vibrio azureus]AUI88851.1 hypothetical protein BS333_20985 [Vibrio azureus]GAD75257.1 hypothetical protein VAZ01S_023_00240 [Vibrio azureus NBRC 104587]